MSWGQMITKSFVFDERGLFNRQVPSVSSVVSLHRTALVAGNGSFILQAYGLDLHGPTLSNNNIYPNITSVSNNIIY